MKLYDNCKQFDSVSLSFLGTAAPRFSGRRAALSRISAMLGICMVFIILCVPLAAQASGTWRSGWFGDIRIGGGVVGAEPSGLDVYDDNEKRDRLGDDGADVTEGLPLIAGEIGYGFENTGTMISAGGGMEDPWFVSIGQKVGGWGMVSLSGLYEEGEVWENPYLTGVDRDETDAESFGFGLGWDGVMGTGLSVFATRTEVDVDRDRIGEIDPDLQRDGADTTIGIRYPWNLGAGGVLSGGIRYILIDRDGDANSGHGYAAELNHMLEWGRFSFATGLELVAREFDETHPIFDEKREEAEFTISETISFAEPFGLKNSYLFGIAGYSETAADIDFFDSAAYILGAGVGYRF
jgi:hypothetical protein